MMKPLLFSGLAVAASAWLPLAPAEAQSRNERVVTVFGDDPCPTNSSGDEVVVCVRRNENERYRIPQELREPVADPENESWAARAQSLETVGAVGINSCSPVGSGGWTGCYDKLVREAREERRQRRQAAPTP